jgi:hypothetical protein
MKNSLKERTRIQHGVIKEEYRTPQMEIIAFETEDIITASGGKQDDGVINLPFVPAGK